MAEYVRSSRGGTHLHFEGYRYKKNNAPTATCQRWRCVVSRCKGKASTASDCPEGGEVSTYGIHHHVPDPVDLELVKVDAALKTQAVNEPGTAPRRVLSEVMIGLSQEARGKIAPPRTLKRRVQRARTHEHAFPAAPGNIAALNIPDRFKDTSDGRRFLLIDTYPEGEDDSDDDEEMENERESRIIIFATDEGLDLMERNDSWFFDGTFKVAPRLFFQLFSIHVLAEGTVIPCVYALLQNKHQSTYERVFGILKNKRPNLNPSKLLSDFEKAAIVAFTSTFPDAEMSGCFFHLGQAVWRNVQDKGLRQRYIEDEQIRLYVKFLCALAFVPSESVPESFDTIQESEEFPDELEELYSYFELTYVGRALRQHRRRPRYPISFWNMRQRTEQNLPRTNNAIEGWHNGIQASLSNDKPSIWAFLEFLKKEENLQHVTIESVNAGNRISRESKKQIARNQRLQTILPTYNTRPLENFLRGIAYNIEINV